MLFKTTLGALALVLTTGMASALTITAIDADCDLTVGSAVLTPGVGCGAANRSIVSVVNNPGGGAIGQFYSLGLGGSATFSVTPDFTGPGSVMEVTWGNGAIQTHRESVQILGSSDGLFFTEIANVENHSTGPTNSTAFAFTGSYSYIRFTDTTESVFPTSGSTDGFDLAQFSVTPVPLPAGALLLMTAIGGLGIAARRRRRNAAA